VVGQDRLGWPREHHKKATGTGSVDRRGDRVVVACGSVGLMFWRIAFHRHKAPTPNAPPVGHNMPWSGTHVKPSDHLGCVIFHRGGAEKMRTWLGSEVLSTHLIPVELEVRRPEVRFDSRTARSVRRKKYGPQSGDVVSKRAKTSAVTESRPGRGMTPRTEPHSTRQGRDGRRHSRDPGGTGVAAGKGSRITARVDRT